MFEHLKERLQSVQQDFTTGFKTLGEKSKESKVLRKPRSEDRLLHFSAGLHVLHRYEESWFQLHRKTKDSAQAAQQVDGELVMLCAVWDKRSEALGQLQEQLQTLPALICDLDSITSSLALLEGDFEEMESRMVYLETLCCQCEQQKQKQQHLNQLENYKNKRRKELNTFEMELNQEHAQKVHHMEQKVQQKLKQKQKEYEEAFHQDMEKYRSSGFLTHTHRTEAAVSDESELDQISVTNTSDLQALDDFLNSDSEDLSSPTTESRTSETSTRTSARTSTRTSTGTSLGSASEETWSPDCVSEDRHRAPGPELEERSSETDSEEPEVEEDHEEVLPDPAL